MGNNFNCIQFDTPESFMEYLDSSDSDFLIEPQSFNRSDMLDTVGLVDSIKAQISNISKEIKVDSSTVSMLSSLHHKTRFQAFGVDKFFNPAPREDYDCVRSGPICVICDSDNMITYVNSAYIEATGLSTLENEDWRNFISEKTDKGNIADLHLKDKKFLDKHVIDATLLDKIKFISQIRYDHDDKRIGETTLLYAMIYDDANLLKVKNRLSRLLVSAGYNDIFTMKLSKRSFLWTTLNNQKIDGNIRSAIEVTPRHPLIRRLILERNLKESGQFKQTKNFPFGFHSAVYAYKRLIDQILDGKEIKELDSLFDELQGKAIVGDTFIDESNYLVRGFDGKKNYFNREFSVNTDMSPDQLMYLLENGGDFVGAVYGNDNHWVIEHLSSLRRQNHYFSEFYPIVNGRKRTVTYDTFRYDGGPTDSSGSKEVSSRTVPESEILKTFGVGALEIDIGTCLS